MEGSVSKSLLKMRPSSKNETNSFSNSKKSDKKVQSQGFKSPLTSSLQLKVLKNLIKTKAPMMDPSNLNIVKSLISLFLQV
jgi:hypothetical protein